MCAHGCCIEWNEKDEDEEDKKQWEDDWEDEESDDFSNQLRFVTNQFFFFPVSFFTTHDAFFYPLFLLNEQS